MLYRTRSGVLPERLDAGADPDGSRRCTTPPRGCTWTEPDPGQAGALVQSFPVWAERIATLERALADLGDRPSHDPTLSA